MKNYELGRDVLDRIDSGMHFDMGDWDYCLAGHTTMAATGRRASNYAHPGRKAEELLGMSWLESLAYTPFNIFNGWIGGPNRAYSLGRFRKLVERSERKAAKQRSKLKATNQRLAA